MLVTSKRETLSKQANLLEVNEALEFKWNRMRALIPWNSTFKAWFDTNEKKFTVTGRGKVKTITRIK